MIDMNEFLGHPISYWIELQKRVDRLEATRWLEEITVLSAKVYFYEKRIREMEEFRKSNS